MAQTYNSPMMSASTLVKTGFGHVLSITIGFKGVTPGDLVTLKDGVDMTGHDVNVFVFPTANGTIVKEWPKEGKNFFTGIYYNQGATTGSVWTAIVYR